MTSHQTLESHSKHQKSSFSTRLHLHLNETLTLRNMSKKHPTQTVNGYPFPVFIFVQHPPHHVARVSIYYLLLLAPPIGHMLAPYIHMIIITRKLTMNNSRGPILKTQPAGPRNILRKSRVRKVNVLLEVPAAVEVRAGEPGYFEECKHGKICFPSYRRKKQKPVRN